MYEICKVLKDNFNKNIYVTVAWTDLRAYGKTIADSLSNFGQCRLYGSTYRRR